MNAPRINPNALIGPVVECLRVWVIRDGKCLTADEIEERARNIAMAIACSFDVRELPGEADGVPSEVVVELAGRVDGNATVRVPLDESMRKIIEERLQ